MASATYDDYNEWICQYSSESEAFLHLLKIFKDQITLVNELISSHWPWGKKWQTDLCTTICNVLASHTNIETLSQKIKMTLNNIDKIILLEKDLVFEYTGGNMVQSPLCEKNCKNLLAMNEQYIAELLQEIDQLYDNFKLLENEAEKFEDLTWWLNEKDCEKQFSDEFENIVQMMSNTHIDIKYGAREIQHEHRCFHKELKEFWQNHNLPNIDDINISED